MEQISLVISDGGRAAAGFKGETGDCVARAVAIAADLPYRQVYHAINQVAKGERTGRRKKKVSNARLGAYLTNAPVRRYVESLGFVWVPTMQIGQGCKVHVRADELPKTGRLILSLSRHAAAVVDGVLYDNHDSRRDGMRCVYGYFIRTDTPKRPAVIPTLSKIIAADGQTIAVATRIDADGLLRIDVFPEKSKTVPVCSGCVTAKGAR